LVLKQKVRKLEQEVGPESLVQLLINNKKELDAIALNFLPKTNSNKEIATLYQMMRDYPSRGGKGFRGSLCLLWCELSGGKREDALVTAAALELFQNWILIHDDIEDESDLRRGHPALQRKYGIPLSINAGDALHGKMWELLLTNQEKLGEDVSFQILREFSTMLNETTEGQQMELSWTVTKNWSIAESDYLLMVTKKSAWYTCISPARLGVLLGHRFTHSKDLARHQILRSLIQMGTDMGIAFQIVDDVLNLTASQERYGKEILGDIFEGKRTLMMIHLLSNCSADERKKIISILSKPRQEKTIEEVKSIFDLMTKKGAIEYASDVAHKHAQRGLSLYDKICHDFGLSSTRSYDTIRLLLEYLVKRDY
jgi:geranylgeranyl diphosphate synthase, type II